MIIIGLDPGSICTGYAAVAADGMRLCWIGGGVLRPPRGAPLSARLLSLYQGLQGVLREIRPHEVALEEAFVGRHARPALVLGHARGALIVASMALDLPVFEYAPRLIKLAATGMGGASKDQVQTMVRHLVAEVPPRLPADASDALAAAICHAHRMRARVGRPGARR